MKHMRIIPVILGLTLFMACNDSDKQENDTTTLDSTNTSVTEVKTENTRTSIKTEEIPTMSRTHFEAKYPQASDITWNRYVTTLDPMDLEWEWYGWPTIDTNDYMVTFDVDNNPYWVWYDEQGNWIGSLETISVANVPAAVNKVLQSEYNGYTIQTVKRENDKNRVAYEIEIAKGDDKWKLLIDENGNIMKKKARGTNPDSKEKNI